MPIAIQGTDDAVKHNEEEFIDENELQSCLERNPYLVLDEDEPQATTVKREVRLPNAGILDVLLVDKEGTPIAIEAKLARNNQSRREVVAQAFDYVSDLSQLTFDELDDLVEGNLSRALEAVISDNTFSDARKQCGINLRAGKVKLVVAVDKASDGLVRIVQYINDHSDIDARLVVIGKYNAGRILVPRLLVAGKAEFEGERNGERIEQRLTDPYFQQILDHYNSQADARLKTRGMGNVWRTIRPDTWPKDLHYAFGFQEANTEIGLHIESNTHTSLITSVTQLAGSQLSGGVSLEWTPRKQGGGWLWCTQSKTVTAETVAQSMHELIKLTYSLIEKEKC